MPIGGFVVHILPEKRDRVLDALSQVENLTIYGHDERGHIIVVLETETSEDMQKLVESLAKIDGIINFDLAYLHGEDEVERIEKGEYKPKIRFSRFRPES